MHWHLAYCASISEAAFSYSPNGRHWDADQLVYVLLDLQGALVNWPPQAHLEGKGKLLTAYQILDEKLWKSARDWIV